MKKWLYLLTFLFIFTIVFLLNVDRARAEGGVIAFDKTNLQELEHMPKVPPISEPLVPNDGAAGEIIIQATDYIKSAQVSIYNNGSSLKISGHTDSYMNADKITTTLYLQVWDSSRSRWVDYSGGKEFVKYGTNYLYNFVEYIAPKGYYYRTRGVHKVTMGSKTETFSSVSSSIYYF
ncbi:hypothetical protein RGU12_07525 [Fredinandcohnia sp. QZ13]|uniref:hypothetical protein n=1 Tax=Fredinandcohnia sp. QZ13 TaxID=3073144 RepID=UPI0028534101|nr:hypothetical protein [Fredinandcohnia sp. QZ13]MDR4887408.1 hypothetical protein [Fredinandcohnia sp. QZ13]